MHICGTGRTIEERGGEYIMQCDVMVYLWTAFWSKGCQSDKLHINTKGILYESIKTI